MNEFKSIKIEIDPENAIRSKVYINDVFITNLTRIKFEASIYDTHPLIELETYGTELSFKPFEIILKPKCPMCGFDGEKIDIIREPNQEIPA